MAKCQDTALAKFLRAWLAWAEKPGRRGKEFNIQFGLCANAERYSSAANYELSQAFEEDGLDRGYPFGGNYRYWNSFINRKHKDPVRLAWVRYYLARFDAGLV